ncbi:MAG: preprotein translocase subunit YajC [Chloroflexi bacterium]|nr:preprotein translocase subunit YajC [Chloroflexota bacterium]MCI0890248.1 preprotein translocase subunit YajC [Chloroflexota bacterium]
MNLAEISFIIMLAVMAVFYLMFIRPARKEQDRQENTIRDLRVGDEVETTAGFIGIVNDIDTPEEGSVQITIDFGNEVKIRALSTSVLRRISTAEERAQEHQEAPQAEEIPEKAKNA